MKPTLITITLLFTTLVSSSQVPEKVRDSILKEAKTLYRSEMASWYGTDIFVEKFKEQLSNARGYFSYDDGELTNCIFFSKDETPKVLATISFDSSFSTQTAKINNEQRDFTTREKDLYAIRTEALKQINEDSFYTRYKNTNFNLIPLVENRQKKVYILTGTTSQGIVIIGNDYLLTFDDENRLVSKKRLHNTLLQMPYNEDEGEESGLVVHTHLPELGEFMTATDICTTMLYQKLSKWRQHLVISKNYVSIWNCDTNNLVFLTKEAWDKIYKN